ncbi:MAG: TonB-dependent receptor plug domain-containing protein [Proteobacteria bacterium]|nr:TonB-dependent receptor plug domain-containing protein [Pseudomonadota bacterium]
MSTSKLIDIAPDPSIHFTRCSITVAVAIALCLPTYAALADVGNLEEIVVTATRRSLSTLDVPYNISAVSADRLEANNINDVASLMRSIPGLASYDRGPSGNGSNTRIIIRGLNVDGSGTSELRQVTVSPVSIYVDETPIFVNLHLSDIDRVEVLRGPQGTLYGSGALGGTVRFLHHKPQFDATSGNVKLQAGQTSDAGKPNYGVEGTLNIPITSTFALRANAGYSQDVGFVDLTRFALADSGLGVSDGAGGVVTAVNEDVNESTTKFVRLAARFQPSDMLTVDLSYHRQEDDADGRQAQDVHYRP